MRIPHRVHTSVKNLLRRLDRRLQRQIPPTFILEFTQYRNEPRRALKRRRKFPRPSHLQHPGTLSTHSFHIEHAALNPWIASVRYPVTSTL